MHISILYLILISFNSFFISFFFGKKLGYKGTFLYIILCSFINMSISWYLFIQMLQNSSIIEFEIYNWIVIELINISWTILIDPIAASMLLIINSISFCAHMYSFEYLKGDPYLNRFYCYLSLFTFFMIHLVLSENVIQLFIGWEGVGICSYLLINYWSNRIQANKSSILAVLANKIGDITLLLATVLLQNIYKSISFQFINSISFYYFYSFHEHVNNIVLYYNELYNSEITSNEHFIFSLLHFLESEYMLYGYKLELCAFLLIISCIGKSAQFGFHFWLPEAMEGPTPVSSLIHAATMVTAGIFLILRFSNFFILISNSISFILLFGSITLFFASSIGLTQIDIKKIVAYSTCSQLGYMFLSCGFQNYIFSMYHLFIHAFFKALLFLTAGYLIHLLSNEQDIRKMGGLLKLLPFSYILMLIGSYSIAGLPYLSGFYSKDLLIENVITSYFNSFFYTNNSLISFILILSLITVLVTALYSFKSIIDIYYLSFKGFLGYVTNVHYSSFFIQVPLALLSIATIYSGYLFQESMVGINTDFLSKSIWVSHSTISNLLEYNYEYNYYIFSSITKNNTLISEFFPYYRFYILHILIYTLSVFILFKAWVSDFFFFFTD